MLVCFYFSIIIIFISLGFKKIALFKCVFLVFKRCISFTYICEQDFLDFLKYCEEHSSITQLIILCVLSDFLLVETLGNVCCVSHRQDSSECE